ncbi:hypothetical protein [Fodinibius saliphilus]|uniref:hypothetical protein n=1 Tax=Fodinibius saliphilus TaxID=1920650 RepID=UPI001107C9B7|nr:hypothetical protein [Fodinibius saliphilus]
MNEQSNNSDPLEEFFRKKSQEYDIEYREEDWENMETRLDKADKFRRQRRQKWLAAAVIALLFAVLTYITYNQQLTINKLANQLDSQQQITTVPPSANSAPEKSDDIVSNDQPNNPKSEDASKINKPPAINEKEQENLHNKVALEDKQDTKEMGQLNLEKLVTNNFTDKNMELSTRFNEIASTIPTIKAVNRSTWAKAQEETSNQISATSLQPNPQFSRFSIGFLSGPDLSSVGTLSDFQTPGYKLGLSIEYKVTRNFAISVGVQRTKVQYQAKGDQYSPPPGYWSYGRVPDETIGRCILLDIPITIKYDFMHFNHSRLYASAGLSSYIMLDEDYQFNYQSYHPGLKKRWHQRTGTSHWLSNATLSVGYEIDITQELSLRATPFVKLPLKKVGWGNVHLYSLGSLFSINYNIK